MPFVGKRCSALLFLLFVRKTLSFLDGDKALIIRLLLLIGDINGEIAIGGFMCI